MTESPRSTRAVSADGRWEAVFTKLGGGHWVVVKNAGNDLIGYRQEIAQITDDTGQSAEQVLAQWEREDEDG